LSCDLKLAKLSTVHTDEGKLFQIVASQHENRRAAVFVDEDCVEPFLNLLFCSYSLLI